MRIYGSQSQIDRLVAYLRPVNGVVRMQNIFPVPWQLIDEPVIDRDAEILNPAMFARRRQMREKHGYADKVEFRLEHWGTTHEYESHTLTYPNYAGGLKAGLAPEDLEPYGLRIDPRIELHEIRVEGPSFDGKLLAHLKSAFRELILSYDIGDLNFLFHKDTEHDGGYAETPLIWHGDNELTLQGSLEDLLGSLLLIEEMVGNWLKLTSADVRARHASIAEFSDIYERIGSQYGVHPRADRIPQHHVEKMRAFFSSADIAAPPADIIGHAAKRFKWPASSAFGDAKQALWGIGQFEAELARDLRADLDTRLNGLF